MEAFLSRTKRKTLGEHFCPKGRPSWNDQILSDEEASTDLKLATLASLFPNVDESTLLDLLISADGSVEAVQSSLSSSKGRDSSARKKSAMSIGYQTSLAAFRKRQNPDAESPSTKRRALTRKGQTLRLYTPEDTAAHTPCSIIHNFLPSQQADDLLKELLHEAPTFERQTFKLFDNVVQSPHSACFYVESLEERERQRTEYLYNGSYLTV